MLHTADKVVVATGPHGLALLRRDAGKTTFLSLPRMYGTAPGYNSVQHKHSELRHIWTYYNMLKHYRIF